MNDYEEVKKMKFIGYAEQFLDRCNKESKQDDRKNIKTYAKLVELDSKLGTIAAEQLFRCLQYTTRWDIIKV